MTKEKVMRVFEFYASRLQLARPGTPAHQFDDVKAAGFQPWQMQEFSELAHLNFMCSEGQKLIEEGRTEKAMRWLGFLQGVLWARGFYSLDDLKNHSRPDGPI